MLIVVSPAKALDYESRLPTKKYSEPRLLDESAALVDVMRERTPADLAGLMGISDTLAELNFERFNDWERPFTTDNARPALLAFAGDVYLGMDAPGRFGERDYTQAQKVLRILSGLYGVLRPLDLMQAYRLEMGTKLDTDRGRDLYEFWGDRITDTLNEDLAASPGAKVLVNLASNEYFGAVQPDRVDAKIISPVFLDAKEGGEPKIVSFFAKRARGTMAGWIIRERITTMKALTDFAEEGYAYSAERSTPDRPVFVRAA